MAIKTATKLAAVKTSTGIDPAVEAVILAGGLSSRMGRDKSRLKLGGRTLLSLVRSMVGAAGMKCRVIRQDAVPRCGPLGGIYTALLRAKTAIVVVLACDDPFVAPEQLSQLAAIMRRSPRPKAVYSPTGQGPGFPLAIRRGVNRLVLDRIHARQWSVAGLMVALSAVGCATPRGAEAGLNINTPMELAKARQLWQRRVRSRIRTRVRIRNTRRKSG